MSMINTQISTNIQDINKFDFLFYDVCLCRFIF